MQLRRSSIAAYVALATPNATDAERAARIERLTNNLLQGRVHPGNIRIALAPDNTIAAALRLHPLGDSSAEISRPLGNPDVAAGLLGELMEQALVNEYNRLGNRPLLSQLTPAYREALLRAGFRDEGERVEFKSPMDRLPEETGTPLTWQDMEALGRDTVLAMLVRVAEGDPTGAEERVTPGEAMDDWLSDAALSSEPRCVQVGFLDREAVAFVCAQVAPKDGWSRITYMGLVPAARSQGLGQWVHRRGFAMMRAQGGVLYHGGTAATNKPMVRLFEKHGCEEHLRMRSFDWVRA